MKYMRASFAFLTAFAWLSMAVQAAPDVTAAEARAFLGGRTGKVVYLKDYNSRLYYIDLSDSALQERSVAPDQYCNSPMISADGNRVLYESLGGIYIRFLEENSLTRFTILSAPIRPGYVYEPRWWVDPATGDEYVIYSTGYMEEHEWPQKSGQTYIQKLDKNLPSGPARMLLPFVMGGGRSRNGLWGATSNHATGMFKFVPGKIDSAFYASQNWMVEGSLLACNPSISTSKNPALQDRMMHLHSGQGAIGGKSYENHKAIVIRSWNDKSIDDPLWYLGEPGDNCNNDSSGNLFWNFPEWANDENYFVLTGSKEIDIVSEGDLYFSRIHYDGPNRILRIMKGGSKFYFPNLWIKDGQLPAGIHLDRPSLSFFALRKDSVNPEPQVISISNAGDGTLPELRIGSLPNWLKVEISGNGTNAPLLTVSVARDSVAPGDYRDTVTVSFGNGVDSQTLVVTFNFSDPVLTSLVPYPATAVALPGETLQLGAIAYDQNGRPLVPQPGIVWSGLDGLDLTSQGIVHVDTIPWRTRYAIASAGSFACTTKVWVARHYLKVDAGTVYPAPGWQDDTAYGTKTTTVSMKDSSFDLFGAINPAPKAVYQTFRFPAPAYRFPDLPNGRYHVRLHFTSPDTGLKDLQGAMSVRIQGTTVLEGYKLPVQTKDGGLRVDVKEASVSVANSQGLSFEFQGATVPYRTAISGLEVYDEGVVPIHVTAPNGGERVHVGDTLAIRWEADSLITSCGIQISVDSGLTWKAVTRRKAVQRSDAEWGNYRWTIPDSLDSAALISEKVMFSVYDYFGADRDRSDRSLSISVKGSFIRAVPKSLNAEWFVGASGRSRLWLRLPVSANYQVFLTDLRGRFARTAMLSGGGILGWEIGILPAGLYRLQIVGPGLVSTRLVPLF